ncbi:MAG: toll/interleukin-1 receptor domain-containing protein [Pyrinomonadaceae bacterium]
MTDMPQSVEDYFISHASADNTQYVQPLAEALRARNVSYLLDNEDSLWGDSFPSKINEWFRKSRYTLLCLSHNFLQRHWTIAEMDTAFALQNKTGQKKFLPLILNSRDAVLDAFPLLTPLVYKEFDEGIDSIADTLATLVNASAKSEELIRVAIESANTGIISYLKVPPRAGVNYILRQAQNTTGVKEEASFGTALTFKVRWVLVDTRAEDVWNGLDLNKQQQIKAVVMTKDGPKFSPVGVEDNLEDLGVRDGVVFHLHGIDNNPRPRYFGGGGDDYGGGGSFPGGGGGGGGIVFEIA